MLPTSPQYLPTSSAESLKAALRPIAARGLLKLFISGPDGSGKAFLVQRIAQELNHEVLVIRCTPDITGAPYQPIEHGLKSIFEESERRELARDVIGYAISLVPIFGSYITHLRELAERWHEPNRNVFSSTLEPARGVVAILNKISKKKPVLLLLEDFQSYDKESVALISSIVHFSDIEFSIVITADPGFRVRKDYDFVEFRYEFTQRRGEFTQRPKFHQCTIGNLQESETKDFIRHLASDKYSESEMKIIHEITNGNPNLILETLHEWFREEESTGNRPKILPRFQTDEYRIPQVITTYAERRLRSLDAETKKILAHASVIGPIFESALLSEIYEENEDEIRDYLKAIQTEQALITTVESGIYKFCGSLSYLAIYSTIDAGSAAKKHLKVANALSREPSTEPYRLYQHLLQADKVSDSLSELVRAIDYSYGKCLNRRSTDQESTNPITELVSMYLELGTVARIKSVSPDVIEGYDEKIYDAAVALAEAQMFPGALSLFTYLYNHGQRVETRAQSLLKIGAYQWIIGDHAAAASLTRVLEAHSDDLGANGLLEARLTLASVLYHRGDWEGAKRRYQECFFLPHLKNDAILLASIRRNINMFYISDLALPLLKSSLSELFATGKPDVYWELYHNVGCVHLICGDLEEARIIFSSVAQKWSSLGYFKFGLAENNLGIVDILSGSYESAQQRFENILKRPIGEYEEISGRCHLAIIDVLAGNPAGLEKLRQLVASEDVDQELPLRDVLIYNLGWALYRTGEYQEARTALRRILPTRPNPWTTFQSARVQRLLRKVESRSTSAPEDSTERRLLDSGRRDKWVYLYPDFAISELWCWE